jgi:hypothetical protein
MLFIGHFSVDEIDADGNLRHGYLSCIVDATSPDEAVAKFGTHIKALKGRVREMINVVNVYIEEILRIKQIPQTPVVTRLQFSAGEFPASISHSLPGVVDKDVDAFGFTPDVEKQEMLNDGRFIESEPFITFDS